MSIVFEACEPRHLLWIRASAFRLTVGFCWVRADGRKWWRRAWFYNHIGE